MITVAAILNDPTTALAMFGAGLIFVVLAAIFFHAFRRELMIDASLDVDVLEISAPKEVSEKEEEGKKEIKELVSYAEQMFANLHSIAKPTPEWFKLRKYLSFEIVSHDGRIIFYAISPRKITPFVEKIIHGQYPKALVRKADEYNIFSPQAVAYGVELRQKRYWYLPLRTYKQLESDPLPSIANSLSKLQKGEGSAIQILIKPARDRWIKRENKVAREMVKSGVDLTHAIRTSGGNILQRGLWQAGKEVGSIMAPKNQDQQMQSNVRQEFAVTQVEQEQLKLIQEKGQKLQFVTKIRIVAGASTKEAAEMQVKNVVGSFTQFNFPGLNGLTVAATSAKKVVRDYIFRRFGSKRSNAELNTEELASIYHLPTRATETPNLKIVEAKEAPPPANMPKEGVLLGKTQYRDEEREVRLKIDDRRRHMYVIGTTGTGKTTIFKNMTKQDILEGRGVCVMDPHGDYIEDILSIIPKERAEDVVLFDPADVERPIGLNMLEWDPTVPETKDFVVNEMIAIFHKLFPPEMIGPMFEHNMRNVMLTLMDDVNDPGTLVEIPRMFTDEAFARTKLKYVKDPIVRAFWEKEMAKTNDFHKSEMLGYLVSKVGQFVENTMMRNIIGQQRSGLDFEDIMDHQKILLCKLTKGTIGEINSSLLGLIIQTRLQMAAFKRAKMPEEQRQDFFVYMDEFQNFVTPTIATILSEARKYRLVLQVAHQYIAQLTDDKGRNLVRDAVFGNVGTMCVYRVGATDAEYLEKEFHPVFNQSDLIHTPRFTANVKLSVDLTVSRPFTMKALKFDAGDDPKRSEAIRQISRLKHGKPREMVERDIERRAQLGDESAPNQDFIPSSL